MAKNREVGFLRTAAGVKLMGGKYSIHLDYEEIAQLNAFVVSGARASSPKLEQAWERSSIRKAPLSELEAEIDRRAALRDARLEAEDDATRAELARRVIDGGADD